MTIYTMNYEGRSMERFLGDLRAAGVRMLADVDELAALTIAQPTALLCYEADFDRCHRTYVARAVAKVTGAQVCHITADGLVSDESGSSRGSLDGVPAHIFTRPVCACAA